MAYCVEEPHHPDEIREAWARLVVAMIAVADSMGRVTDHISMRHIVGELSQAISWQRIRELMKNFYDAITGGQDQPESVSLLVKACPVHDRDLLQPGHHAGGAGRAAVCDR